MSCKDIAKVSTISIDCSGKTLDMFNEDYTASLVRSRRSSFEDCEVPEDEYSEVEEYNIGLEDDEEKKVILFIEKTSRFYGFI